MDDKQLPEAPISIHVDSYLDGFHVGWTKRLDGDNLSNQVAGMGAFIKKLKDEGYMPSWNSDTNVKHLKGVTTDDDGLIRVPVSQDAIREELHTCNQCGAVAVRKHGLKKNKQPWAGLFCMDDKTHVQWL